MGRRAADPHYDRVVADLPAMIKSAEQGGARRIAGTSATALQASLLIKYAPAPVADTFCATRLGRDWGHTFGTLPANADTGAILDRTLPLQGGASTPITASSRSGSAGGRTRWHLGGERRRFRAMTEQTAPDQASTHGTGDPTPPSVPRTRLHWVDNLRVGLTILVIIHHCALTYGNIPLWFYNEVAQDPSGGLLDVVVIINQTFFMGLFFFLSGLFVPRSIDRKGPGTFSRDRLIRLGIPLLGFLILLRPLAGLYGWLTTEDRPSFGLHYLMTWDPGPTWFLEVLLVFSLAYAVITAARPPRAAATVPRGAAKPSAGRVIGFLAGLALVIGAAMGLWMQLVPTGTYWPVVGLPTPSYLPQYAIMFALGVIVTRRDWLRLLPGWAGWIGVALFVVALPLFGASLVLAGTGTTAANQLAEGLATGFAGVGLSLIALVVFRRLFNRTSRLADFLSANAFAVYVIHPVVLVWVAVLLSGLTTIAIGKFAVLLIISVPACWLLAALLRRVPAVGRVM